MGLALGIRLSEGLQTCEPCLVHPKLRSYTANCLPKATRSSWQRLLRAWLYVPVGILCVLAACWGIDRLIGLSPVSFPASVALLILLFFGLLGSQALLGDRKTRKIVAFIDVPVGKMLFQLL